MSGIIQYESAISSGSKDTFQQVFWNNKWVQIAVPRTEPFTFKIPQPTIIGGTNNYYQQISDSIFTSVSRPFFRFYFTGNTSSFSNDVEIVHDLYAIEYADYTNTALNEDDRVEIVKQKLENKIFSFTGETSGFTLSSFIHDYQPPEFYKNIGNFKKELFTDRGQYFLSTTFKFDWNKVCSDEPVCVDYYSYDENDSIVEADYEPIERLQTFPEEHIITANTEYSGCSVQGQYFTYFIIPNAPKIESPTTINRDTLSPLFAFSNANDGDEALVQVVYNPLDTDFEGVINAYNFDSTKKAQNFPLLPNREFIFRIGNRKFIIDIFGIKRSVISYSLPVTGATPDILREIVIEGESDNPQDENIPTPSVPPSIGLLDEEPIGIITLSGTVDGSIVTGATVELRYPSGFKKTQTSDLVGNYSFTGLNEGLYTLTTDYRGYKRDVKQVNLLGNTELNYKIKLVWGNKWDTFGDIGGELIGEN